ncbi:MAG: type III secretion system chaperone [Betaproteobacteria bacterium]
MNLEQAQQLIRELGVELGGQSDSYTLDEQGEANLVFDDEVPVLIRFADPTLVLACAIAVDVRADDPGLFATLMDYQFMGLRTFGCVLSWNSAADSLVLSRQLHGEPTSAQLAHELNILLRAGREVREDLLPLLEGDLAFASGEEDSAEQARPAELAPMMFNRA